MSRCFPYPPAGYALSRASEESLIESIKFPNERVKSKERKETSKEKNDSSNEQKEKRREKKEKPKEKKDKTNVKLVKSHLVETHLCEKTLLGSKAELLSKEGKADPEHLERSSLTEEHGNPTCVLAPSISSDSTDNNSKKRKTCSSPAEVTRGHGNILRIRLPSKKPKIELQQCSTSERTNIASQNENNFCSSSRNDRDQICSTSQPVETMEILKSSVINTVMTPMQREELQYINLMDSFVPSNLLNDAEDLEWLLKGNSGGLLNDAEDLEWLLKGNSGGSSSEKKRASGSNGLACAVDWGLWPRAQYLQEADVYALPYTVPF